MTKNTGYIGYRIILKDLNDLGDVSIIEHSYTQPVSLKAMSNRVVKFIRQNKLMEDVEGYKLINIDPREDLYLWRELTPHRAEWKFTIGRKEEE